MISLIQLVAPLSGLAYLIDEPTVYYRTLDGQPMDPAPHDVLEAPASSTPSWYTPPDPVYVVPEAARHINKLDFRLRFTVAEKATIELASLDDPLAGASQRQMSALLRSAFRDLEAARFVDLDFQETRNGVLMLESEGLIATGRALEILDAPVQPSERA